MYILLMVDPDAPSRERPVRKWWRHWLLTDVPVCLSDCLSSSFPCNLSAYTDSLFSAETSAADTTAFLSSLASSLVTLAEICLLHGGGWALHAHVFWFFVLNPFKPSGVNWLHFRVFRAILV